MGNGAAHDVYRRMEMNYRLVRIYNETPDCAGSEEVVGTCDTLEGIFALMMQLVKCHPDACYEAEERMADSSRFLGHYWQPIETEECAHCHREMVARTAIQNGNKAFCSQACNDSWEPPDGPDCADGFAWNH